MLRCIWRRPSIIELYPVPDPRDQSRFSVEPLHDSIIGDARRFLMIMLGAVGPVLFIACSNVASLLLVRAIGRKRELATCGARCESP